MLCNFLLRYVHTTALERLWNFALEDSLKEQKWNEETNLDHFEGICTWNLSISMTFCNPIGQNCCPIYIEPVYTKTKNPLHQERFPSSSFCPPSYVIRSKSSLGLLLQLLKVYRNMLNSNLIPINTQSNNNARRLIAEIRVMAPRLSSMNIAHMQLNKRNTHTKQGIANSHRGMRISARVDNDAIDVAAGGLDAVDDCAFVVGLEGIKGAAVLGGDGAAVILDIGEGSVAVDVWLAGAEEVKVRTVDEED